MFGFITRKELEEAQRAFAKRIDTLEYEWADWYQKFRNLHARLAKQERSYREREAAEPGDGAGGAPPSAEPGWLSSMDPISRQIWRRRLAGRTAPPDTTSTEAS